MITTYVGMWRSHTTEDVQLTTAKAQLCNLQPISTFPLPVFNTNLIADKRKSNTAVHQQTCIIGRHVHLTRYEPRCRYVVGAYTMAIPNEGNQCKMLTTAETCHQAEEPSLNAAACGIPSIPVLPSMSSGSMLRREGGCVWRSWHHKSLQCSQIHSASPYS
jgi:hypothetical protein